MAACGHIYVHSKAFKRYCSKPSPIIICCFALAVVIGLTSWSDIYVAEASYLLIINTPIENLTDITSLNQETIIKLIKTAGINNLDTKLSIKDLSEKNQVEAHQVLEILLSEIN